MRKQTKLAVGLSAAALLAIGATMTSFAARGWVAEGDQWYYYDSNGDYVTDKWKSYNGNYFYLGDEGYMLTNELIEDNDNWYFVDANGAMVKNAWIPVPADDGEEQDVDYRWYYFGSNGKAYKSNYKKTINGKKYGFDDEGKMLFGFVGESYDILNETDDPILACNRYYGTNDDGAMYTGWLLYTDALTNYDDQYYWFWFNSSGVKYDDESKVKKINGKEYRFNNDGVMLHGWEYATYGNETATPGYFSNEDDGSLQKSRWIWDDDDDISGGDGDDHWWYVDKHGARTVNTVKKINGRYYAFDDEGIMQWGFVWLDADSYKNLPENTSIVLDQKDPEDVTASDIKGHEGTLFYFSSDEEKDGSMKTGTSIKIELYDDTYTFGFDKTTGAALHGPQKKNKKLFDHGILQTAGDDKYVVVTVDGEDYLVSVNGTYATASKTKTYKDADDTYWGVAKSGEGTVIVSADTAKDCKAKIAAEWTE